MPKNRPMRPRAQRNKLTPASLSTIRQTIICCDLCPRLRTHCARVAQEKKFAYRTEDYWGKPVPGFGNHRARVLVVGLAPAAHGANRTGRVFTGDGSGDFLMRAMHSAGFANIPTARHIRDGLKLHDAYITAAVRCAPPANKPTRQEIENCQPHLEAEVAALSNLKIVVALGRIAFDTYWRVMRSWGIRPSPKPAFKHGLLHTPDGGPTLIASYHPSRQNTNTGRLTPPMLASIFRTARRLIASAASK